MLKKVQISDRSIETAGICKDYKDALAEYIWNSFDADASKVEINIRSNEIGGLEYLEIVDDGKGICFETIDDTFGAFLASDKVYNPKWSNIHGSEGKGRFSFLALAFKATWLTVYEKNESKIKYQIVINSNNKDYMDISERESINCETTGTRVILEQIHHTTKDNINSTDFKKYLANTFAWFLYLNKDRDFKIIIDEKILEYSDIIDDEISESIKIKIDGYDFKIYFIKWVGKISERYYYYFMDSSNHEKYKQYTSFNNDNIEFPHSLYIVSSYFDDFIPIDKNKSEKQITMYDKTQKSSTFSDLIKELKTIVETKRKKFIKEEAPRIIKKFNEEGAFPKFKNNKYDQERKKDLESVVTEIYSIQPRIFKKCNLEQKKSILGFLNLLLDTDERKNIINIMEDITKLTPKERDDLNNVLKKTSLVRIIKTMKMIENRYVVIGLLRKLVYDLVKFTNERDHIQKIIEDNYWLFGEQYNLVSADVTFEKALKEYLYIIDSKDKNNYKIKNQDSLRRPDIFMCRSRSLEFQNSTQGEENIIVELKKPEVVLNKKVFRQVEDYMDLIMHESKFNSELRKWKFIMVSTSANDFIKRLHESLEDKGKPFLVRWDKKFEIYAMTWDDVFKSFEIRHSYLLDKLQIDKAIIEEELEAKGIEFSRKGSNELAEKLSKLKAN